MRWKKIETYTENIHSWTLTDYVRTEFDFDQMEIDLVSEDDDNIDQFDFEFITDVINKLDFYFTRAIEYLQSELRNNPNSFKISEPEFKRIKEIALVNKYVLLPDNNVEKYISVPTHEFPVNQPNITFYSDNTWLIRFAKAAFPAVFCGHGVALFFDKSGNITDFTIVPEE